MQNKSKTPKISPINSAIATSRSSPIVSNIASSRGSNSATPEMISNIQPKMENSPPPNRSYEQIAQRQTVLMWGSNQSRSSDDGPLSARSPCDTPKSVNESFDNFSSNNALASSTPSSAASHEKQIKEIDTMQSSHHQHQHIKWNGNACGNNKEVISIFPIHHNNENSSSSASPNTLHSVDTRYTNHVRHNEIPCEVGWPYSQYQYFSYHHVSNAHHQHPTSTQ